MARLRFERESERGEKKMDELIKKVSERTGLSEDKAKTAVDTVVGFLKEKLPSPIAGQIDNALNSGGGMIADKADDIIGGIGGMFGKS
jgi:ribosomal protein L7/L12